MPNKTIQKPTLSDYNKIYDFSSAVIDLNSTLQSLNNHIELVKRTGDVVELININSRFFNFLTALVSDYKSTLSDEKED